ncbi:hypothetical protein [Bacillus sp. Au-Bac7]|uniref:hypothetical protein n=1 Tax=Bacillus sp. Au-Bac7 TaxID=2906458 RepID=UPI001E40002C|nr:hypothetical protein [Bacillus sp. Au-Bac7]MCE4051858.1 hypothetical protein [Bacillus sp. Au-Bac7]
MRGCSVKIRKNDVEVETYNKDELLRKVKLVTENEYIVNPLNPQKLKNRGRTVIFKGIHKDEYGRSAKVIYKDTKRPGKIEFEDFDYV